MLDDDDFPVMVMMPAPVPMMAMMFLVNLDRRADFHRVRFSHGRKKAERERQQNN
jgi:hypothetical protein